MHELFGLFANNPGLRLGWDGEQDMIDVWYFSSPKGFIDRKPVPLGEVYVTWDLDVKPVREFGSFREAVESLLQ